MNYTEHLGLNKPQPAEQFNISHWNDNSDKIDDAVKNLETTVQGQSTLISNLGTQVQGQSTLISNLDSKIDNKDIGVSTVNGLSGTVKLDAKNLKMDSSKNDSSTISNEIESIKSNKQDKLTIDSKPTQGSNNPISSGSVYNALAGKQNTLTIETSAKNGSGNPISSGAVYNALAGKQNTLTFDSTPTQNSNNPVTSGGVYNSLSNVGKTPRQMTKEKICEVIISNTATSHNTEAIVELKFRIFDKGYSYIGISLEEDYSWSAIVPLIDFITQAKTDETLKGGYFSFPILVPISLYSIGSILAQCDIIDQVSPSKNYSTVHIGINNSAQVAGKTYTFILYGWK